MLEIYNSLTRRKEPFVPIEAGRVRMYVCGMTVYDYCHLGHGRVMVVFDMVTRYLRARGYTVSYIRNITDIDDKIIKRANENGEPIDALTARFILAMHEDAAALGVEPPDEEPRATVYIAQIIAMIQALVERGYAYRAANGDVYYHVRKFAGYGRLSGKSIEDLRVGARVEAGEDKQDPLDFVLWKAAKPGEPSWDSPWGPGRPGWHIECSAMSTACLGEHFDIHGGGLDLQFPHHENEIAQSEGASGHKFVNVWMHNGFVRVDDEKMSKSLGNFFTIREILKRYDPEVVRYFILASHYRSPLNYSDESLDNAKAALTRLYIALKETPPAEPPTELPPPLTDYAERFYAAMDDDFNTSLAMAALFDLARDINRLREADAAHATQLAGLLRRLAGILGLLQRPPLDFLQGGAAVAGLTDAGIEAQIAARAAAKRAKDFAEADRIRDALKHQGVILEDGPGGTTWRRA
ncbi:MAG TPA: cysteine--tRNA ligase [Acidiferrobacterales bacterium]|jgi:cysteinyl-tRNA synthetase